MKEIYLIGIGGSGMKPLAMLASMLGYRVSGSDSKLKAQYAEEFRKAGISVFESHKTENLAQCDTVVYSSAISSDHPAMIFASERARRGEAELIHRMDLLNRLTDRCSVRFGVAGTHGKTSTSSMLGWLLLQMGYDPDIIVGGKPAYLKEGVRKGGSSVAVFETDESDGSFLKSNADVRIILNVDTDHLEHYGSIENLQSAFREFASRGKLVILNQEDPYLRAFLSENEATGMDTDPAMNPSSPVKMISYGVTERVEVSQGQVSRRIAPLLEAAFQEGSDRLNIQGGGWLQLPIPGRHFAQNALALVTAVEAAIRGGALSALPGHSIEKMLEILSRFPGVERRIEFIGEHRGARVYDDYGHHPTEIREVMRALHLRMESRQRLIAVFQPHRYTRLIRHYVEFARELALADQVFLMPLFPAGEPPVQDASSQWIYNEFPEKNRCSLLEWEDLDRVFQNCRAGDCVVFLGAGDISQRIRTYLQRT